MARKANIDWSIPEKVTDWSHVNAALLMDIRDELRIIRQVLTCANVRKAAIATQRIDKRLAKRMKLK